MGDPNLISTAELKRALQRWRTPQRKINACIEKKDWVELYKAEKVLADQRTRQKRERQRQQRQQQRNPSGTSTPANATAGTMQTYGIIGFVVLLYFLQRSGIIGGSQSFGGTNPENDDVDFSLAGDAYINGKVAELKTFPEFESALAFHKDNTGLPVVVSPRHHYTHALSVFVA